MRRSMLVLFSILTCCLFSQVSAQDDSLLTATQLKEDFEILRSALTELHPGIYRYRDAPYFKNALKLLERDLDEEQSLGETYLEVSRFVAEIRCGHTLVNPYNQNDDIRKYILSSPDKLPFTFSVIEGKMLIASDVSDAELPRGTEVVSINGNLATEIISDLMKYVSADGSNNAQRLKLLEVNGTRQYETFDTYFPLLYPPIKGRYILSVTLPNSSREKTIPVKAISAETRRARLFEIYPDIPRTYDDLWRYTTLDKRTALLTLGTFVTYKMDLDWEVFLDSAFTRIKQDNIENLIIDIRGNGGGMSDVALKLLSYLTDTTLSFTLPRELVRYEKVDEKLNKYLSTWDDSFRDRTGEVVKVNNRFYEIRGSRNSITVQPDSNAFDGNTIILTDASNSSATFTFCKLVKQHKLGVLIGEPTGGNLKGINGGNIFFLHLPNSGIEIDIPLIGYYPQGDQPDRSLQPDLLVMPSARNFAKLKDTQLLYAIDLLRKLKEPLRIELEKRKGKS